MNSCQEISELFSDYVEKALPEKDCRDVEIHLQICSPCERTAERLANLRAKLRTLPAVKTSPDFETVLRTRMRLERHRLRPWSYAIPLLSARAMAFGSLAILIIVGGIYFYLRQSSVSSATLVQTNSLLLNSVPSSAGSLSRATLTNSPQLYFYTLDNLTIPQAGGVPLSVSAAGVAKYQSTQADSAATGTADQPDLDPLLISF